MILFEEMESYQDQAAGGDNRHGYMSSHSLAKFSASPRAWKNAKEDRGYNPAFSFGTAYHTLVGEGLAEYNQRHPIGDSAPVNPKTNKPYGKNTAKYKAWSAEQEEGTITAEDDANIHRMHANLQQNQLAVNLLDEHCIPEAVMRGVVQGVAIQGRFDLWRGCNHNFVDIKTTRGLDGFPEDFKAFGYDRQLAFYMLLARSNGYSPSGASIIACEKTGSMRTAVYNITEDTLNAAIERVQIELRQFAACRSRDHYPAQIQTQPYEL